MSHLSLLVSGSFSSRKELGICKLWDKQLLIHIGCLPFVRINRLGRALNNGKGFSKISKPTERNGAYHLHVCTLISRNCFRLMRDWKQESLANGKEIFAIPFRTEKEEYL